MKIIQKILFFASIAMALTTFIYTLSFSSGWALGKDWLGDFYLEAQTVNKLLFKWALWGVIFSIVGLIFNTHLNRNYYVTNFLFILLTIGCFVITGVEILDKVPPLKEMYLALDPFWLDFISQANLSGGSSTAVFEVGIVLAYLLFAFACLLLMFSIYKLVVQLIRAKTKQKRRLGAKL
ncbi:MAG: hypothetical protein WCR28_00975 [Candidatus Izemoplasmatales bacterium]|jgi:hypothetical protein|nr:hypothetical protein [Candidatus Izemoplasmatales bacterium]MDD4987442.1 hypothetical protein [Candidatus Izemoplasmatales bacterium]MDY0373501.1 hypothetical protein [Candidatus Izemoplasmatales bacterium]NLF48797.1 hypothetical protein [Acholeplasmataceae bacterium]